MRKPPVSNWPDFISDIGILTRPFRRLPLHHNGWNHAECIDEVKFDEICDSHIETFVEIERCVEEEFAGTVGGEGIGVGALG